MPLDALCDAFEGSVQGRPECQAMYHRFWARAIRILVKLRRRKLWQTARVTVQTDQIVTIRQQRVSTFWCDECGHESEFIPAEVVDRFLSGGLSEGKHFLPGDPVHTLKAPDGSVVVCMKSLSRL